MAEKGELIAEKLEDAGIPKEELNILIAAYKAEQKLVLYAKKKNDTRYKKLQSFDICASSGLPGPKRKSGDRQVPEGFYHISVFNPLSDFYLSLGINYPNAADYKKIDDSTIDPGGDIYIHGNCVTIGCLPLTDDKIKELYLYASQAKENGQQKIPVYIFPFEMSDRKFNEHKEKYKSNPVLVKFWKNLKAGFDKFEREGKELSFMVDEKGNYVF